jgi:pyrimidine operon attenuation protein / uracil phosphoribosyltransferase
MEQTLTRIVTAEKVYQKIKRIAFEIAEDNYDETEIVIAGICKDTEGYVFAELIFNELVKITSAHVLLTHIELDKNDPGNSDVELNLTEEQIDNKTIIVVDDVANTGRTILYAIKPLLSYSPKKIRNAVLVERKHKLFPVSPDYVGLSLSTTMHEHIKVILSEKGNEGIYLK